MLDSQSLLRTVMEETQEHQLSLTVQENNSFKNENPANQSTIFRPGEYKWWLQMAIYTIFVLAGEAAGMLLGRLYFDKGGKSKWMSTLVQTAGFPVLIPFLWTSSIKKVTAETNHSKQPSVLILGAVYASLGIFLAANSMLYSIGMEYLPVSTYSLICASQLGFNAIFSHFLNSQKFTPFIMNSLVLLTISSALLVFQGDSGESQETSKGSKYALGFLSTIGASSGYSFMLSVTQLFYQKIIKRETFRVVLDMSIYQSLVATMVIMVGLFASGEWNSLETEMEGFELGKLSYVMTLVWTAVSWQIFNIGCTGLIFQVSSLFSNVISTFGLPIPPVLAVIFFHDKMNGVKVMALLLAIWGFTSYIYQEYIDDQKKSKDESDHEVPPNSIIERG